MLTFNPPAELDTERLVARLEAQGFTDVSVTMSDGKLQVFGLDPQGGWIDNAERAIVQAALDTSSAETRTENQRRQGLRQRMVAARAKLRAGEDLSLTELSDLMRYILWRMADE